MKKFNLSCNNVCFISQTVMAVIIYILMWIMVDNGTSLIQHIIRAGFSQVILYAAWKYLAETKERLR